MTWPWVVVVAVSALCTGAAFGAILMGAVCGASRASERLAELDHTYLSRSVGR